MNISSLMFDLIRRNPEVSNNPRAKESLDVIMSGDSVRGAEIADNLCRTYGVTRDEALKKAQEYFGIK